MTVLWKDWNEREKALAIISDIFVEAELYEYDREEDNFVRHHENVRVSISDGPGCDDEIVWADHKFAQNPDHAGTRSLFVNLVVRGEKNCVIAFFRPHSLQSSGDYWKIGARIDANLNLMIYVGDEENYAVSEPVSLAEIISDSPYFGDIEEELPFC